MKGMRESGKKQGGRAAEVEEHLGFRAESLPELRGVSAESTVRDPPTERCAQGLRLLREPWVATTGRLQVQARTGKLQKEVRAEEGSGLGLRRVYGFGVATAIREKHSR